MTKPSIERIEMMIADFEKHAADNADYPFVDWLVEIAAMRDLIASWRARGKAAAVNRKNWAIAQTVLASRKRVKMKEADVGARFDRVMAIFKNAWAEEYPSEPFSVNGWVTPRAMEFINGYAARLTSDLAERHLTL